MRRHDHRHPGGPPGWWPETESWPPQGGAGSEEWKTFGRRMFGRLVLFFLFLLFIAAVIGGVLVMLAQRISLSAVVPLLTVFGVLALIASLFIRVARRSFLPVRRLIDAAGKLADGDYSARIDEETAGPARPVVGSFNAMAQRLEDAEEQRRRLMADLSHELRNPLAVIRGEAEAVVDGVRPPDREVMESLLDEVATMERLIEDLGTLTQLEQGSLPLELELVDVAALVEDVAGSYRPGAASAGVEIPPVVADRPYEVIVDPVRIRQALSNVVVNGLRAMPDGGTLTLAVGESDGLLRIDVTDTGRGIDPIRLPHVFERFVKADDSPGQGLGLPIARSLLRAHGGDLEIVSSGPDGTTVTARLPTGR